MYSPIGSWCRQNTNYSQESFKLESRIIGRSWQQHSCQDKSKSSIQLKKLKSKWPWPWVEEAETTEAANPEDGEEAEKKGESTAPNLDQVALANLEHEKLWQTISTQLVWYSKQTTIQWSLNSSSITVKTQDKKSRYWHQLWSWWIQMQWTKN